MNTQVRLESWKEIAAYLGRSVRTVQRWEQVEGLPIHRLDHQSQATVYAYPHELDEWWKARSVAPPAPSNEGPAEVPEEQPTVAPESGWTRRRLIAGSAGIVSLAAAAIGIGTRPPGNPHPRLRRIVEPPGGIGAVTLSSDGRRAVARFGDAGRLGLVAVDLEQNSFQELIAPVRERVFLLPQWSPDGKYLAWLEFAEKGLWNVVLAEPDATHPRVAARIDGASLSWTSDSQRLLVADKRAASESVRAHLVMAGSTDRWPVSNPPRGTWGDVISACAPDGEHFAVVRYISPGNGDIYLLNWQGSLSRRLTHVNAWIGGLSFTPDGRYIVFDTIIGGRNGLYRVSVDGSDQPVLVETPGIETPRYPQIAPTPDGQIRVAFSYEIWRCRGIRASIGPTGIENERFLSDLSATIEMPCCSGDGQFVACFESSHSGRFVRIFDLRSASSRVVAKVPPKSLELAWAPDQSTLALTADHGRGPEIWLVDVRSQRQWRLTQGVAQAEGHASWSANGQWIYFRSSRDGFPRFFRLPWPFTSGPAQAVTPVAADGAEGPNGWFLFIENDQRGPLMRIRVDRPGSPAELFPNAPELRGDHWRVVQDGIVYVDFTDGRHRANIIRQSLTEPSSRRYLATLHDFATDLIGGPTYTPDLREVIWAQQENKHEAWLMDGLG